MNIYYQGNPGSYMHAASQQIQQNISCEIKSLIGKTGFKDVRKSIGKDGVAVLAIENSYMGSIHPNLYAFLEYDYKIIGEYYGKIDHCLCSKETDISNITTVYSQIPALEQCHKYIEKHNLTAIECSDTALSAKIAAETHEPGVAGICSELAAQLHGLNILDKKIQDQTNNTTRFAIIAPKDSEIQYTKKSEKISIIFETNHLPSSLYQCLGCFARRDINLLKIESLPSYSESLSYHFWIDFGGNFHETKVQETLSELIEFTRSIRIIGEY